MSFLKPLEVVRQIPLVSVTVDKGQAAVQVLANTKGVYDASTTVYRKTKSKDPKTTSEKVVFGLDVANIPLNVVNAALSMGTLAGMPKIAIFDIVRMALIVAGGVSEAVQAVLEKEPEKAVEVIFHRAYDLTTILNDSSGVRGGARDLINFIHPITAIAYTVLLVGKQIEQQMTIEKVDEWISRDWPSVKSRVEDIFDADFDDVSFIKAIDNWIFKDWTHLKKGLLDRRAHLVAIRTMPPKALADAAKVEKETKAQHRAVIKWEKSCRIPACIANDDLLQPFLCTESGKPMRFIVRPIGTVGVFYDEKAIEDWISDNPNKAPEGWPNHLDVTIDNLEEDDVAQHWLEKALKIIADRFQQKRKSVEYSDSDSDIDSDEDLTFESQVVLMENWKRLKEIPPWLRNPAFKLFICGVTGKPVRFAVRVKDGSAIPTIYEKAVILELMRNQPAKPPIGWPQGTPFTPSELVDDLSTQTFIDRLLELEAKKLDLLDQFFAASGKTPSPVGIKLKEVLDLSECSNSARQLIYVENAPHCPDKVILLPKAPIIVYPSEGIVRLNLHLFAKNYFLQKYVIQTFEILLRKNTNLRTIYFYESAIRTPPDTLNQEKVDKFIYTLSTFFDEFEIGRLGFFPEGPMLFSKRLLKKLGLASEMGFRLTGDSDADKDYLRILDRNADVIEHLVLHIDLCESMDEVLTALTRVSSHKKITLEGGLLETELTPALLKKVIAHIRPSKTLTELDLGETEVSAEDKQEMMKSLTAEPRIKLTFREDALEDTSQSNSSSSDESEITSARQLREIVEGLGKNTEADLGTVRVSGKERKEMETILEDYPNITLNFEEEEDSETSEEESNEIFLTPKEREELLDKSDMTPDEVNLALRIIMEDPEGKRRIDLFKDLLKDNKDISFRACLRIRSKVERTAKNLQAISDAVYEKVFYETMARDGELPELGSSPSDTDIDKHVKWLERDPDTKRALNKFKERIQDILKEWGGVSYAQFWEIQSEIKNDYKSKLYISTSVYKKLFVDIRGHNDNTVLSLNPTRAEIYQHTFWLIHDKDAKRRLEEVKDHLKKNGDKEFYATVRKVEKTGKGIKIDEAVYYQLRKDYQVTPIADPHNTHTLLQKNASFSISNFFETFFEK